MQFTIHRQKENKVSGGRMLKEQIEHVQLMDGRINFCNLLYVAAGLKPVTRFLLKENSISKVKELADKLGVKMLASDLARFGDKGVEKVIYFSRSVDDALAAMHAELEGNHDRLGELLGYPACCRRFFAENYSAARMMYDDYTLLTLQNSSGTVFDSSLNFSLRYFDYSFINHFPCSFNCTCSLEIAKRYAECIRRCAPHIYDEIADALNTAVIYDNETGVHAFKHIEFADGGFHYSDVRQTLPNEVHSLLERGDCVRVVGKNDFIIAKGMDVIKRMRSSLSGVMIFR